MFKLRDNGTTVGTEIRAGVVTFLTMSYIIFVQPIILSGTGLSWHSVFVATCISSAVATLLMAFLANYPIALAPAMGQNVLFLVYCRDGAINWQTGLGAICISGLLFLMMSLWGIREKIIAAVPDSLKSAISVGIGLFIAFLGFQWAGLVVRDDAVLVRMGDLHSPPVLLALGGLLFTTALIVLKLRGAILIGMLATAIAGVPLGITSTDAIKDQGLWVVPRSQPMAELALIPATGQGTATVSPETLAAIDGALSRSAAKHYESGKIRSDVSQDAVPEATTVRSTVTETDGKLSLNVKAWKADGTLWRDYGPLPLPHSEGPLQHYADDVILGLPGHSGLLKLDVLGALKLGLVHVIFVFFFLDLFDTIGTLIGVSQQAGFLKHGRLPRARGALMADALGTVVGAGMGTSTVTSYVESAAGVADGARTGLANIVTALLFLTALFFSPLVQMIGGAYQQNLHPAIAPVLIIIGSIMVSNVTGIRWKDPTEALPAFLAMMLMPLTFSITEGIAFGFISYAFLKTVAGRHREVHWLVYLFAVLFIARYVYAGT
jgi:xanthine/uracil/vitamin C permease (AzgA family)